MAGKFVLKQTDSGKFMFRLQAGNGQTILTSELYQDKSGAKAGIESVRKNAVVPSHYDCRTSSKDQPYFVLKAANGEIIGTSEMYSSQAAMENGMASVKENAPDAVLDDQTIG